MYDVLLRGGRIVDGSGGPPVEADLAIQDEHIAAVGALDGAEAAEVVDATERLLMPGFVDAHVHGDALITTADVQLAALRQGVTTLVLGQDGVSFAPASGGTIDFVSDYFGAVNGACPEALRGGCSVSDLLDYYTGSTALNAAYLAPSGTIRAEVMGVTPRRPDRDELLTMRAMVERALEDGAVGLSSGMVYVPDVFSNAAEMATLCQPVAAVGGVYVTHMRGYEAKAPTGMAEVIDIASRVGVAAHISHYHGPAASLIVLADDARRQSVDLTFDTYPYLRGCTILAMLTLPPEIQRSGLADTIRHLTDPASRRRLRTEWFPAIESLFPRITVAYVAEPGWAWCEGLTLVEAARASRMPVDEFICDLLVQARLRVGCTIKQPATTTEADLSALLRREGHMAGSDGIFLGSRPHPRGWGAFARLLGHHTRDLGDWTWGEAAVHLSSHACGRFGLKNRGLLRAGYSADVVVVDPENIGDHATYDNPRELASGIGDVWVNGVHALQGGQLSGAKPGKALRFGAT